MQPETLTSGRAEAQAARVARVAPPGATGVASAATTATVMLLVRQAQPVRYRVDMVGSPVPLAGGLPALIQQRLPHPPVGIARPGGPMCTGFRLATAACLPMSSRTWGKQPPPAMPAHPVGGDQRGCLHPSAWPNEGWCRPVTPRRPTGTREANGGSPRRHGGRTVPAWCLRLAWQQSGPPRAPEGDVYRAARQTGPDSSLPCGVDRRIPPPGGASAGYQAALNRCRTTRESRSRGEVRTTRALGRSKAHHSQEGLATYDPCQ
jgi:hypothetical protein